MQSVSSLFTTLWNGTHRAVVKAVIDDTTTVGEDKIVSLQTEGALFAGSDFTFGGCISRQFEMSFYPGNITIPRMAKVQLYMQLTDGTQTSEWISKGIFYIDTRETDHNGLMTITGYDVMLKAEQEFTPASSSQTMQTIATSIATSLGVSLDSRCSFLSYSVKPDSGYSMREILGYIAAVHGGNWIITDVGALRLVRTNSTVDTFTITNSQLTAFDKGSTYSTVSKVIIYTDDENSVEAGDTTGRTVEVNCPWGTTAMAQTLLSQLSSASYTPCRASVLLHPAAEIGDKFTVSSVSYYVATLTIDFNSIFISEIENPGENEIDHEYQYESVEKRATERKIATLNTEVIQVQSDVEELDETVVELTTTVNSISATVATKASVSYVEQTASTLRSEITTATSDKVSQSTFEQRASSIEATVSTKAGTSGGSSSTFSYSLTSSAFTLYSDGNAVMTVNSSGATIGSCSIVDGVLKVPVANIEGTITATALVITDNYNRVLLSAQDNTVQIANFYTKRTSSTGALYTNNHSSLTNTTYSGIYLGDNGIDLLGDSSQGHLRFTVSTGQLLITGNADISGKITATSGTFYNSCVIGSSTYNWTIAKGSDNTTCLYTPNGTTYAGSLFFGADNLNVGVHIGGDGFSYWLENDSSGNNRDYSAAIRPGYVWTSGDGSTALTQNTASMLYMRGLNFYYGGTTNVRKLTTTPSSYTVGYFYVNSSSVYMGGTFTSASSISVTSDRDKKNTISNISNSYSTLFDNLIPRTFKYNDGQSNRLHTGFIAQEVKDAMDTANITTQEFGAYVSDPDDDGNPVLSLRYAEFVALNTMEIQKLKARVAQLEQLINS